MSSKENVSLSDLDDFSDLDALFQQEQEDSEFFSGEDVGASDAKVKHDEHANAENVRVLPKNSQKRKKQVVRPTVNNLSDSDTCTVDKKVESSRSPSKQKKVAKGLSMGRLIKWVSLGAFLVLVACVGLIAGIKFVSDDQASSGANTVQQVPAPKPLSNQNEGAFLPKPQVEKSSPAPSPAPSDKAIAVVGGGDTLSVEGAGLVEVTETSPVPDVALGDDLALQQLEQRIADRLDRRIQALEAKIDQGIVATNVDTPTLPASSPNAASDELEALQAQVSSLKEELASLNGELSTTKKENAIFESRFNALDKKYKDLSKKYSWRVAEVRDLKKENTILQRELKSHRSRPLLPGWKITAIGQDKVVFREKATRQLLVLGLNQPWNGLIIRKIDASKGLVYANWGTFKVNLSKKT